MKPASSPEPLHFQPVHALSAMLGTGEVSSQTLVQTFLGRIDQHDGELHSMISIYRDDALKAARAADEAISAGYRLGPLHGIPIVVKDIVEIRDRVTTGGSRHWRNRRSAITADLVTRLVAAGMILLGKTHTVEFAMGSFGTNRHVGTPRNPWDPAIHRAPGGSSSGTAVAVAAGMAPCGIGSDTGGSIRVPSSWCGISGLKTTVGRISTHGVLPLAQTLDTPGPMGRDVEDCAMLLDAMQSCDVDDRQGARLPRSNPWRTLRRGVEGLVLARLPRPERRHAHAEVLQAYDESLVELQRLGARIVDVSLPLLLEELGQGVARIIGAEGYANVGHLVEDMALPIDDDIRPRILIGKNMRSSEYLQLLRHRENAAREWNAAFDGIDAFVLPTTATCAPPITDLDQKGHASIYTRPINYVDWCALALPNGISRTGNPTSLQIACRGGDEAMALRIGWAYQQATCWHQRTPPLA
jgi:aspartyl-tRNA(Asn)/glutamyl-tRNA(Gln) amidotransferase subunit A